MGYEEEVTKEEVRDVISDVLGLSISYIQPKSSFKNDLGADSLDMVDIILECENKFDIHIEIVEMDRLEYPKGLYQLILSKSQDNE